MKNTHEKTSWMLDWKNASPTSSLQGFPCRFGFFGRACEVSFSDHPVEGDGACAARATRGRRKGPLER